MPSLSVARNANAAFTPTYVPVMVVTGATAGIGQAMAEAFARHQHGRVHIILIGRNRQAAEATIASLPKSEDSTYEFFQCDLTLMKNIHAMTKDLLTRLPKINFLVHCAGYADLKGRIDTEEGIDMKLAARYYQKFALTYDLLPLVRKAKELGEAASVIDPFGAGMPSSFIDMELGDLGLKKSYSAWRALFFSGTYNDLMMAEFARREPEIAFVYTSVGAVYTSILTTSNPILWVLFLPLRPLFWLLMTSAPVCAEYMLFAMLDADKGFHRRDQRGNDIGMKNFPQVENAQRLLWEHSVVETRVQVEE
ncbi:hypothetical protein NLJ89_g1190 [Agrocybe chaxingu]|uniref:NAD(P)-binding protein n=1 Tax=Agrocybe chaxingu TaxID=84603 RepID=A0A9W8N0H1_9AGAR|nr:hypothetical protein NLJ89_g1190 [Agrocybe chaxingu]